MLFVGRTRYRLPLAPSLARKWDALGRELDYRVLASAADGLPQSDAHFELLGAHRLRALDGALFYLALPLRIRRAIRAFRPVAVVAEDPHVAGAALLGRALAGRPRPKLIAEIHGNWRLSTRLHGSPVRKLLAPFVDVVDWVALKRADAVRALSPYTARLAADVRGESVAAEFPTYTDLAAFTSAPLRPLPNRPTALFVGVLELYKNVDGLVAAWPQVVRRVPDGRLVVVGQGSRRNLVEQLVAELPGSVEHVPELGPSGVAEALDDATVLVLPSRFEGFGRVVIESFARGRGVVGARAGGLLDLVEQGRQGLLVDPEDVERLADALVRVLSDRSLAERLGAAAAESYPAWHSTPEGFASRYRALVDATCLVSPLGNDPGAR